MHFFKNEVGFEKYETKHKNPIYYLCRIGNSKSEDAY